MSEKKPEKTTREYCLASYYSEYISAGQLLNNIIAHGNFLPEFSSRFLRIEIRISPSNTETRKRWFWSKPTPIIHHKYWLIVDTTGLNENQFDMMHSNILGWIAGYYAGEKRQIL